MDKTIRKHPDSIRDDILVGLHHLYEAVASGEIKEKALKLIERETDAKYKKKYAGVRRS